MGRQKKVLALLGLGIMGEPMARNLLRAGFPLRVWNRTAARMESLIKEGAVGAASPAEAAAGSDLVITIVSDATALEETVQGPNGALNGMSPGALLVNMGTQGIAQVEALGSDCQGKNVRFLDSPVTGSRIGATEGTLTLLVGGEKATLDQARPVLEKLGTTILHLGRVGDGTRFKLVLNLIQAGMLTVWAEGLSLGVRMGLSPSRTQEVLESSAANSPLFRFKGNSLLQADFSTHFSLELMDKDLGLGLAEAARVGAGLPVCQAVGAIFSASRAAGLEKEDFLAITKVVEKLAGAELIPPRK